jgi:hypothetical protein
LKQLHLSLIHFPFFFFLPWPWSWSERSNYITIFILMANCVLLLTPLWVLVNALNVFLFLFCVNKIIFFQDLKSFIANVWF